MTEHENYYFDVCGYLVVRNALSHVEVDTFNKAFDAAVDGSLPASAPYRYPFLQLRDHPVLRRYLSEILGEKYHCDEGPELVGAPAAAANGRLCGGGEWVDWSRAYRHQGGVRLCQGVRALWALADVEEGDGGFVLIPASHNSEVEAPDEVLSGEDDMGLTFQPGLRAGDLLLCAHSLVHGVLPWKGTGPLRTLAWTYVHAEVRAHDWRGGSEPARDWLPSLTPAQRAVLPDPDRDGLPPPPDPDRRRDLP